MPAELIMSVSGVRGIVGASVTPSLFAALAYVQSRAQNAGPLVVGTDTRPSGAELKKGVIQGIVRAGGRVIDIGVAPTPTTCVAVKALNAAGGIILTASHNPEEYNGYKMVHPAGRLFRKNECDAIYRSFHSLEKEPFYRSLPAATEETREPVDAISLHLDRIVSVLDVDLIRRANLFVAVDSINGAAGAIFPQLLSHCGVRWKGINTDLTGIFPHNPEPRPEHCGDIAGLLRTTPGTHCGFIFDPDADRLALMGENGEPISEEMTLALALSLLLSENPTDVAVNLSTSMVIDDICRRAGATVYRTPIGEANVVEAMEEQGCRVGGEGNGGVIYPRVSMVRDGLTAMALILQLLAREKVSLTQLCSRWKHYTMLKEKFPAREGTLSDCFQNVTAGFPQGTIDTRDGLKIVTQAGWVHLRPSNTEPILRCYAEAEHEEDARKLIDTVKDRLKTS